MNVHYTTTNGQRDGRASHFFRSIHDAGAKSADQNTKAIEMGIKSRYELAECDEKDVSPQEKIR